MGLIVSSWVLLCAAFPPTPGEFYWVALGARWVMMLFPYLLLSVVVLLGVWVSSTVVHRLAAVPRSTASPRSTAKNELSSGAEVLAAGIVWHRLPYGETLRWLYGIGGLVVSMRAHFILVGNQRGAVALLLPAILLGVWAVGGVLLGSAQRVSVGDDGLCIASWWKQHFVGFGRVRRVAVRRGRLVLELKDGGKVAIGSRRLGSLRKRLKRKLRRYQTS